MDKRLIKVPLFDYPMTSSELRDSYLKREFPGANSFHFFYDFYNKHPGKNIFSLRTHITTRSKELVDKCNNIDRSRSKPVRQQVSGNQMPEETLVWHEMLYYDKLRELYIKLQEEYVSSIQLRNKSIEEQIAKENARLEREKLFKGSVIVVQKLS